MKTLLQINVIINSGSTGRIAEEIGNVAIANGWESIIAYGREGSKSTSKLIKIGSKIDTYIHAIKTRLFDLHGLASKKATKKLIKEIENINPDIIHLHNIHGYYINYTLLFKYFSTLEIPIVWTLHDCWLFTGHCSYFSYINCNKWKTHCYKCPQKNTYPKSIFLDRSKQNFDLKHNYFTSVKNLTLIPVSNWLKGLVSESFLKDFNIHRIYNGINVNTFLPYDIHEEKYLKYSQNGDFVILGVANIWSSRKGLNDFVKLRTILPKNNIIILIGLTEEQISVLPKGIIGIQRTESIVELAKYYSLADVFINPTYEDNFPTTNLEALACGTPVITYNTGGSIEAIDAETGFIIEQGDLNTIPDIIETIKDKGREHYREKCRQRALEHFNKDDRFEEYILLYDKLLKTK